MAFISTEKPSGLTASGTQEPRAEFPVDVSCHPIDRQTTAAQMWPDHVRTAPGPARGLSKGISKRVVIGGASCGFSVFYLAGDTFLPPLSIAFQGIF